MRITAAMNCWASRTIKLVRITPISAASWRSAKPSSPYAATSTRHTASTMSASAAVVSSGLILPSAYDASADVRRATPTATAMTTSAGNAASIRSAARPSPRIGAMAREVAPSSTAAASPITIWQTSSRRTEPRSIRHAIRQVCPSTDGSRPHICRNEAPPSGFFL